MSLVLDTVSEQHATDYIITMMDQTGWHVADALRTNEHATGPATAHLQPGDQPGRTHLTNAARGLRRQYGHC